MEELYHEEDGHIQSKGAHADGHQQNPDSLAPQCGKVKVRWSLILGLVLLLVLALDLALLTLQVQDGPPLRVVQGGRPVERAQDEGGRNGSSGNLEAQSPSKVPNTSTFAYSRGSSLLAQEVAQLFG